MKISLIGPVYPYRGGIAHFTTLLAKKLIEANHEVQVVSFKKQYPAWLYPGESDKDTSPGREKVASAYLLTPLNPITWRKTIRSIRAFQPQQVLFPWWVTFWGPAFSTIISNLKKHDLPIAILIHNTLPHETRPWDRLLARRTLQGADRFIVMTQKEKNRLRDLLPEADNIAVAPLPMDVPIKDTHLSKTDARTKLGLPTNKPVLLFFGFVRPYKGLRVLIEALQELVNRNSQAHLLVVGEFWEDKTTYLNQIQTLGLTDRVHIHDSYIPDDQLAPYFKAADLFVAPYVDGTQSAALKTALGFGLPAVATDVITDGMVETLADRCKIVPAGDPTALADGILAQLAIPVQNQDEIAALAGRSWEAMLAAVTAAPRSGLLPADDKPGKEQARS